MRRLIYCALFLLANMIYVVLVATASAGPALVAAYFAAAMLWSLRLRHYRRRDHRGPRR